MLRNVRVLASIASALLGAAVGLPGCQSAHPSKLVAASPTMPVLHGQIAEPEVSFFADRRARRVGDMLTILITESASVSESARTRTDKTENASVTWFPRVTKKTTSADISSDFAGGGQIERSGRLLARLAVMVDGIDERGNLHVSGEQIIAVNNERQVIKLEGVVRGDDIAPDNTIASTRVSGAHIELSGRGVLAGRQRPGWITRLLTWFGQ